MVLRDMEHDRPGFEQDKIAFFIGRNLPEKNEALDARVPSSH
jgi:hypothetical protein